MQAGKTHIPERDQQAWSCLSCHLRLWIVLALVLAADLVSKQLAFSRLGEPPTVRIDDGAGERGVYAVIPGLLEFRTQYNQGAALGILSGHVSLFVAVGVAALGVFLAFFARSQRRQWFFQIGIALVLAGAIGNIYDRLAFSQVRDFIHITVRFNTDLIGRWPRDGFYPYIFNVADMALVVGVAMIMISSLYRSHLANKPGSQGVRKQEAPGS